MQKKKKNENVKTEINVARLKDRSRGIYRVLFLIRVVSGYSPSEREARYPRREEGSS